MTTEVIDKICPSCKHEAGVRGEKEGAVTTYRCTWCGWVRGTAWATGDNSTCDAAEPQIPCHRCGYAGTTTDTTTGKTLCLKCRGALGPADLQPTPTPRPTTEWLAALKKELQARIKRNEAEAARLREMSDRWTNENAGLLFAVHLIDNLDQPKS